MTESKKQDKKNELVWIFRFILICSPFLLFILLFCLSEIAIRVYYLKTPTAFNSYYPQPKLDVSSNTTTRHYSIPTSIAQKATFDGANQDSFVPNTDNSEAFLPYSTIQNVYVLPANTKKRLIKRVQETKEIIYDVNIETDALGRRITPDIPGRSPTKHFIFFGCSYTLGEGVNQNETLPYFTAASTKNYRAYNLGVNGGGISEAWAYTHTLDYLQNIPEQKGYALYVFFSDHISRYTGTMQHIGHWLAGRPLVRPDANGNVHFYGRWLTARPLITMISLVLGQSYLLKHLEFNFPPIQQQDIEDFVTVLKSVRQSYWDRFGSDNPFIVLLYTFHAQPFSENLIPIFEREHIQYLDYSKIQLAKLSNQPMVIPLDNHPNALAHKIIGEQIAEDLNLQ